MENNFYIEVIHSDRQNVMFGPMEEGEAFARFMTESGIQGKVRAKTGGSCHIIMFRQVEFPEKKRVNYRKTEINIVVTN